MIRRLAGVIVLCVLGLTLGCSSGPKLPPPVDTVSGKIVLEGMPLADAEVTFFAMSGIPAEHRTKTAKTDAEGKYTLSKVYPAEYMVRVSKGAPVDPAKAPANADAGPLQKYSGESPLRANVAADKATHDFELK